MFTAIIRSHISTLECTHITAFTFSFKKKQTILLLASNNFVHKYQNKYLSDPSNQKGNASIYHREKSSISYIQLVKFLVIFKKKTFLITCFHLYMGLSCVYLNTMCIFFSLWLSDLRESLANQVSM